MADLSSKHRRTLEAAFAEPTPTLSWRRAVALIEALGGVVRPGSGSAVRLELNGRRAVMHRPHPGDEMPRPYVRALRDFLEAADVTPPS